MFQDDKRKVTMVDRRQLITTGITAVTAFSAGCTDMLPIDQGNGSSGEGEEGEGAEGSNEQGEEFDLINVQDNFGEYEIHDAEIVATDELETTLRVDIENELDEDLQFLVAGEFYDDEGTLIGEDDISYHVESGAIDPAQTATRDVATISGDYVDEVDEVDLEFYRMHFPDDEIELINNTDDMTITEVTAEFSAHIFAAHLRVNTYAHDVEPGDDTPPVKVEVTNVRGEVITNEVDFGNGITEPRGRAQASMSSQYHLIVPDEITVTVGGL